MPYPDIDTDPGIGQRHPGLLGALHQDPHTGIQAGAVAAHRDRQYPRTALRDEALNAAGVLMRTDGPDNRKRQMPAIRLHAHRTGGERHPVLVAGLALEPGKPNPFPSAAASAGGLPVPVGVHRAGDAVGVGLLRALRPPHHTGLSVDTHLVLDGVPTLAQPPPRRLLCCDTGRMPCFDIGFQRVHSPVVSLTPGTEMPRQRACLIRGRVQGELERLHRVPIRDLEAAHYNQSSSSSPHAAQWPSLRTSQSPRESIVKLNSAPQQKHETMRPARPPSSPLPTRFHSYGTPPTT